MKMRQDYSGLDGRAKIDAAVDDIKEYLGQERFDILVAYARGDDGLDKRINMVRGALGIAGVEGYPVDAFINHFILSTIDPDTHNSPTSSADAIKLIDEVIAAFDSHTYSTSYEDRLANKLKKAQAIFKAEQKIEDAEIPLEDPTPLVRPEGDEKGGTWSITLVISKERRLRVYHALAELVNNQAVGMDEDTYFDAMHLIRLLGEDHP